MRLLQIKAAHSLHIAKKRNQLELDFHPITPLVFAQHKFVILHCNPSHRFKRIHGYRKGLSGCGEPFLKLLSGPISFEMTWEFSTCTGITCPPSTAPATAVGSSV